MNSEYTPTYCQVYSTTTYELSFRRITSTPNELADEFDFLIIDEVLCKFVLQLIVVLLDQVFEENRRLVFVLL